MRTIQRLDSIINTSPSLTSLDSITPRSPFLKRQQSQRSQTSRLNLNLQPTSPLTIQSASRATQRTLRLTCLRQTKQSPLSFLDGSNALLKSRPKLSEEDRIPLNITSPFPLNRISFDEQTPVSRFATGNKTVRESTRFKKDTNPIQTSAYARNMEADDPPLSKMPKENIETILDNMKDLSSALTSKKPQKQSLNRSIEVIRNTLEETLQTSLEDLNIPGVKRTARQRTNASIYTILEKKYALKGFYRRKSCHCSWCGGRSHLEKDIEHNPWVCLMNECLEKRDPNDQYENLSPTTKKDQDKMKKRVTLPNNPYRGSVRGSAIMSGVGKADGDKNVKKSFLETNTQREKGRLVRKIKTFINVCASMHMLQKHNPPEIKGDEDKGSTLQSMASGSIPSNNTNEIADSAGKQPESPSKNGFTGSNVLQNSQRNVMGEIPEEAPNETKKKHSLAHLEDSDVVEESVILEGPIKKVSYGEPHDRIGRQSAMKGKEQVIRRVKPRLSFRNITAPVPLHKTSMDEREPSQEKEGKDGEGGLNFGEKKFQGKFEKNLKKILEGGYGPSLAKKMLKFNAERRKLQELRTKELVISVDKGKRSSSKESDSLTFKKRNETILKTYVLKTVRSIPSTPINVGMSRNRTATEPSSVGANERREKTNKSALIRIKKVGEKRQGISSKSLFATVKKN